MDRAATEHWLHLISHCRPRVFPHVIVDVYRSLADSNVKAFDGPGQFLTVAIALLGARGDVDAITLCRGTIAAAFELSGGNPSLVRDVTAQLLDQLSDEERLALADEVQERYGQGLLGLVADLRRGQQVPSPAGQVEVSEARSVEVQRTEELAYLGPSSNRLPKADVLVICALDEEYEPLTELLGETVEGQRPPSRWSRYRRADRDVLVFCSGGQGNVTSASDAARLIDTVQPSVVLMAGIAAGIPREDLVGGMEFGDVIVPNEICGYAQAKVTEQAVRVRLKVARTDASLFERAKAVAASGSWHGATARHLPAGSARPPKVHFGPVLSGPSVVADTLYRDEIEQLWPGALGVEMEMLGAAVATFRSDAAPSFLAAKAVCDWGDPTKDDTAHELASVASASFIVALIDAVLPDVKAKSLVRRPVALSGRLKNALIVRLGEHLEYLIREMNVPRGVSMHWPMPGLNEAERCARFLDWAEREPQSEYFVEALRSINREDLAALMYLPDADIQIEGSL